MTTFYGDHLILEIQHYNKYMASTVFMVSANDTRAHGSIEWLDKSL